MRRAAKVDANQEQIVSALRAAGATVQSLAAIGKGVPDLLVAFDSRRSAKGDGESAMFLLEVKDGAKVPSARALTEDQVRWHAAWGCSVHVVHTPEEALRAIGAIQ